MGDLAGNTRGETRCDDADFSFVRVTRFTRPTACIICRPTLFRTDLKVVDLIQSMQRKRHPRRERLREPYQTGPRSPTTTSTRAPR